MSLEKRVFVISSALVLGLIGLAFLIKPAPFVSAPQPTIVAQEQAQFVGVPARKPASVKIAEGAAGSMSSISAEPEPEEQPADNASCEACREKSCTNYKGLGVDLISGCYAKVDASLGADPGDGSFLADCQAAVACAHEHRCAWNVDGAAGCYCGSADMDSCIERGPAEDSPCLKEWQRAARSKNHADISVRFSDLKYPAGWAMFLIECDFQECKDKCAT